MKKNILLFVSLGWLIHTSVAQSLDDYLTIAAENNPGLQVKKERYEAALQRIPQVSSLPDPTLTVSAFGEMVETRVGQQTARFSLSQMFPWFGTLAEAKDAAALGAEAAYQSYLDARNELFYRVRSAYYPLWEFERKIAIQEEKLEILSTYKSLATTKFQNGTGQLSDALRVDILANDVIAAIEVLKLEHRAALTTFNSLLNRSSVEAVDFPAVFSEINATTFSADSMLAKNPVIVETERNIEMSRGLARVARKKGLPNLGIGFEYIVVDQRPDMSFEDNGKDAYMPMITLSLPIYRKKYKAAVDEARYTERSFIAMKNDIQNTLISEFEGALSEREKAEALIGLFQRQEEQTQRVIDLLLAGYRNNTADFEEILMMQQNLLRFELEGISAWKNLQLANSKLIYLVAKDL